MLGAGRFDRAATVRPHDIPASPDPVITASNGSPPPRRQRTHQCLAAPRPQVSQRCPFRTPEPPQRFKQQRVINPRQDTQRLAGWARERNRAAGPPWALRRERMNAPVVPAPCSLSSQRSAL